MLWVPTGDAVVFNQCTTHSSQTCYEIWYLHTFTDFSSRLFLRFDFVSDEKGTRRQRAQPTSCNRCPFRPFSNGFDFAAYEDSVRVMGFSTRLHWLHYDNFRIFRCLQTSQFSDVGANLNVKNQTMSIVHLHIWSIGRHKYFVKFDVSHLADEPTRFNYYFNSKVMNASCVCMLALDLIWS